MGGQKQSGIEPASTVSSPAYIDQIIAGQADGDRFLRALDAFSSPDALTTKLIEIMASDRPGNPKLRGFARVIQKRLERITADVPRGG